MQPDTPSNLQDLASEQVVQQPIELPVSERTADELPEYVPNAIPIWEWAAQISALVPDEEWEKVPKDLSMRFKYYQGQRSQSEAAENEQ